MKRVVVRAIVTAAIASVAVLALPTAAEADESFSGSVKELKTACAGLTHSNFIASVDGSFGVCLSDEANITCDDQVTVGNCTISPPDPPDRQKLKGSVVKQIQALGAGSVSTQSVSDSRVWTQTVSVAGLKGVCSALGGDFAATTFGTAGACRIPTAIVVCKAKKRGKNCRGIADSKKDAVSTQQRIQALLKAGSVSGPSGTTPRGGPTTTTTTKVGSTTTTTTKGGSTTTTKGGSTTTVPYRP